MARKKHHAAPSVSEAIIPTQTPPPRDPEGLAAWLSSRYGRVILTIPEVASELGRSENALRVALWSKAKQPNSIRQLRRGRVRMGRNLYIGVHALSNVLLNGDRSIAESDDEVMS